MIIRKSQCIFMMNLLVLHTIRLLISQHCLMVGGDLLPTFLTCLKTGNTKQQAECTTIRLHYILIKSKPVRCSVISLYISLIHYDTSIIIMQSSYLKLNILFIGTYDIWRVNYTIQFGALLLTVYYVEGSESHQFYVELQCVLLTIKRLFNGSVGCLHRVPPNEQCTLLVTDADSISFINSSAAVTIENIAAVPSASVTATTSIYHRHTTSYHTHKLVKITRY